MINTTLDMLIRQPPPPQILRDERPIAWPEIPPTELFPIRFAPGVEEFLGVGHPELFRGRVLWDGKESQKNDVKHSPPRHNEIF